jgi:hypothetical protein
LIVSVHPFFIICSIKPDSAIPNLHLSLSLSLSLSCVLLLVALMAVLPLLMFLPRWESHNVRTHCGKCVFMTWKIPGNLTSRNGFYGTGTELKTHKTGTPPGKLGRMGVHNCNTFLVTRHSTSPQRPSLNPRAN